MKLRLFPGNKGTMQNSNTLRVLLLVLLVFPVAAYAQESPTIAKPVASTHGAEFRLLQNPIISADGLWMAAEELRDWDGGSTRVWSTTSDVTFTIERGQNPRISRDSRWVTALVNPSTERKAESANKIQRVDRTLVVIDTKDGSQRKFQNVLFYDVTFTSSYLLFLQSPKSTGTDTAMPAGSERKAGTLQIVHLKGGREFTISNVTRYVAHLENANHGTNDHFGYVIHDDETGRDTLYLALLNPGPDNRGNYGVRGIHAGNNIENLRWAQDNATAMFVDNTETTGKDGKVRFNSELYTWHDVPGRSGQREFTRVDTQNDTEQRNQIDN